MANLLSLKKEVFDLMDLDKNGYLTHKVPVLVSRFLLKTIKRKYQNLSTTSWKIKENWIKFRITKNSRWWKTFFRKKIKIETVESPDWSFRAKLIESFSYCVLL